MGVTHVIPFAPNGDKIYNFIGELLYQWMGKIILK
jgi:hypothetical protein